MKGDIPAALVQEFGQYAPAITFQGGARFLFDERRLRGHTIAAALVDFGYMFNSGGRRSLRETVVAKVAVEEDLLPELYAHIREYMLADLGPVLGEMLEGDLIIEAGDLGRLILQ